MTGGGRLHRSAALRGACLWLGILGAARAADAPASREAIPPAPAASVSPSVRWVDRSESDIQLSVVSLDGQALGDPLPTYVTEDGLLVPLGQFARQLGLAIDVDPLRGAAAGFVIDPKRRFELDLAARRLMVDGNALGFPLKGVEPHQDDIYVDTRLLALWLPVDIKVDAHASTLWLHAREELPLQAARQRELSGMRLGARPAQKELPRTDTPYRLLDVGALDETLNASTVADANGAKKLAASSFTAVAGDFLWMNGQASLAASQDGQRQYRWTLGRKDPKGGLLGPLNAKEFEFGYFYAPGVDLVTGGLGGRGAMVTNFPLSSDVRMDRRSFRGALPLGWQAEIYVNGALLAFQPARTDGVYEFLDVPMAYGPNDIRIVLYGPQGERRETWSHVNTQELAAHDGEFRYMAATAKPDNAFSRTELLTLYGLSRDLNLMAAFTRADLSPQGFSLDTGSGATVAHTYGVLGLLGQWDGVGGTLSVAKDSKGGTAEGAGAATRLGGITLSLKRYELQGGYESEFFQSFFGPLKARTLFDAGGSVPSQTSPWLNFGLGLQHDDLQDGGSVDQVRTRLSTSVRAWFISNELDWVRDNRASGPAQKVGNLLASRFFHDAAFRATASYTLGSGGGLNNYGVAADFYHWRPLALTAGALHDMNGGGTQIYAGLQKQTGRFSLGVSVSHSTVSGWNGSLTVHVGLAKEPRSGHWLPQAEPATLETLVSARAFKDANGNRVSDPGEQGVPGVAFHMAASALSATADANGVGAIQRVPADYEAEVRARPDDPDHPLLKADPEAIHILTRQGRSVALDFPVQAKAEINGTAFRKRGAFSEPFPGLLVELVDGQGKVVASVRSGFDGYFQFDDLGSPAVYTLRVAPSEAARPGLGALPSRQVAIGPDGGYVDGQDLVVEITQAAEAANAVEEPEAPAPVTVSVNGGPQVQLPPADLPAAAVPEAPAVRQANASSLREAVLHGDPRTAAALSKAWLAQADLRGWAVRAQVGALPATLLAAAEHLEPKDGAVLLRPWALANGQCARQFFVAGFRSKGAAQRFAAGLRTRKDLDPPKVVPVKELQGAEPPCSFYAD